MARLCLTLSMLAFSAVPALAQPLPTRKLAQAELPAGVRVQGVLVTALSFHDRAGEHVAVFSQRRDDKRGDARLWVELWNVAAHKASLVRSLKDAELHCEFDLYADFLDAALGVTDLDADGVGELTFAYRTTCTSDVSPFSLKLFLLEQRDKYAVRGSTRVDTGGGELVGGDKKLDPALLRKPAFREHLERVWEQIVALSPWT